MRGLHDVAGHGRHVLTVEFAAVDELQQHKTDSARDVVEVDDEASGASAFQLQLQHGAGGREYARMGCEQLAVCAHDGCVTQNLLLAQLINAATQHRRPLAAALPLLVGHCQCPQCTGATQMWLVVS